LTYATSALEELDEATCSLAAASEVVGCRSCLQIASLRILVVSEMGAFWPGLASATTCCNIGDVFPFPAHSFLQITAKKVAVVVKPEGELLILSPDASLGTTNNDADECNHQNKFHFAFRNFTVFNRVKSDL